MRSNISIAMLSMTAQSSTKTTESFSSCLENKTVGHLDGSQEFEFKWDQNQQGNILASFFIGYFSTHIIGAVTAILIGPRLLLIICLLGSTIFTFLMVYLPYYGVNYLIFGRVMIGFFSGPLYPIVHELIANYAPEHERTKLNVLTHTGNIIGLAFNFGLGGYIVENFNNGWKSLFIMNGMLGALVLILCLLFLYSSPKENPLMSEGEKKLIMGSKYFDEHLSKTEELKKIPFFSILTSCKVYQICLAQFGNSIILYAQLTGHPKYLSSVFGLSKSMASFLSIVPFMANFFFQLVYPFIFDHNNVSKYMSKTTYRRINSAIAFIGAALFLVPVAVVPCDKMYLSIALVSLSMIFLAANQSGFFTAMIDISPSNVGFIMGLASMFGSLSGVIQPKIVGYFTKQGDLKVGYMISFAITAALALLMGLPFILFGTSEEIKWNNGVDHYHLVEMTESPKKEQVEE